ncbi:MAG: flavodoxin-dependent (E)-4-hydroxy-3-methylbut-2-enyl-diphosphate synthase, partial [Armatimonadetes bacterium]|nr:flavodoxin-dependent (E)-4-hydroxy-3-methylbut-2-enyl-diphosphate synthase [Armatimonadota bacterium]
MGWRSSLSETFMEIFSPRRQTRAVRVGNVTIGGGHPVVVQSMTTAYTSDIDACVNQAVNLWRAGCEIVRVTAPNLAEAKAIG